MILQLPIFQKVEAFECDNDANGSDLKTVVTSIIGTNGTNILPVRTSAVFSNMTLLGPKVTSASVGIIYFWLGAQLRRNCEESIFNSVFLGWNGNGGSVNGLLIDASKGTPTDLNLAPAGGLNFANNIIAGSTSNAVIYSASTTTPTGASTASILGWVNTAAYANTLLPNNTDVGLTAPFNYTEPDFNPASPSAAAATGASFTNAKLLTRTGSDLDFTPVTYKGACAVGDSWWKAWSKFN